MNTLDNGLEKQWALSKILFQLNYLHEIWSIIRSHNIMVLEVKKTPSKTFQVCNQN